MNKDEISGYRWGSAELSNIHNDLIPAVLSEMKRLRLNVEEGGGKARVFELGCGNGSVANVLTKHGWDVTGVDPSKEGIARALESYPSLKLFSGSAYDNLHECYGAFPVVTSFEVVEHVYFPRAYSATLFSLCESGGTVILSTPYHGYLKNLTLALTGKMDAHFTALWDYGHIKFWSMKTLTKLLLEAGFENIRFKRVGRIPVLAKSMIAIATKK